MGVPYPTLLGDETTAGMCRTRPLPPTPTPKKAAFNLGFILQSGHQEPTLAQKEPASLPLSQLSAFFQGSYFNFCSKWGWSLEEAFGVGGQLHWATTSERQQAELDTRGRNGEPLAKYE